MNQPALNTKPHVYLIGGWGSDVNAWRAVVDLLTRESLGCSIVDWQSVLRDPQELDRLMVEHQDSGELRPIVLAGWSLGGMLALEAALRSPSKQVAGLAIIASTARMCEETDYPGVDPRAIRGMKLKLRSDREGVLRDFTRRCFTDTITGQTVAPEACEAYLRQSESCESAALADGLNYLLKTDLRDSLDALACRCKILHAHGDAVMPYAEAKYLADRLPHAELESIHSGTHALPIVEPEKTARVILSLCQGGPAR